MWEKKGLIFKPTGAFDWSVSHAQVPVAEELPNCIRIYYSTRNKFGKSNISFIDVEKHNPNKIIQVNSKPLLNFGQLGTFDDCGMMPTSIITINEIKLLYYIGWTTRGSVPYHNAIGIAKSEDGLSFERMFCGPIITTNKDEPYFSGTAHVLYDKGIFKMWYLSCVRWEVIDNSPEPFYNLKYAVSENGIDWRQQNQIAIDLEQDEGGLASASVLKLENLYKMWFCVRKTENYRFDKKSSYRIGYAESKDGIQWDRKDNKSGINLSKSGWDSEMICYPNVLKTDYGTYLFYNGNGFGKTGFGYAVWREN